MKKFKFSVFDIDKSDPTICIFNDCNLHHFIVSFDIDEIECDQEHADILENIYGICQKITENEDTENQFSISKDDFNDKDHVIEYLVSVGGKYEV
ncbi:MAG: hypothetical protein [Caudoviricetes sp.]|nr:MAG: hypothetical protein [Caudoviricetes sp.]